MGKRGKKLLFRIRGINILKRLLEDSDEWATSGKIDVDDVDAFVRHRRLVEHRALVAQQALVDLGRVDRRLLHVLPGRAGSVGCPGVVVAAARNGPRHGEVLPLRRRARDAPARLDLQRRLEVPVDHRRRRRNVRAAWKLE